MTAHFVTLLDELRRRSLRMASQVEDIVQEACESVYLSDERFAERIAARDRDVDIEEVAVEAEVIRLMALYQPVGADLRLLCTVLKLNNDLERISDCAVNIAERAKHLELQPLAQHNQLLRQMGPLVRRMVRNSVHSFAIEDADIAQQVLKDDGEVDRLYAEIVKQIIRDATAAPDDIAAMLDLLSVAKNLERIADHATNIAEDVIFLLTGTIVRHQKSRAAGQPSAP
jgi:phosphate transport system protein